IALHRPLLAAGPEVASTYLSAIGDILRQQKNSAKAAKAYRKAIEQKLSPAVYHQLGLALRDLKKQTEANAAFDRAIELYRESTDLVSAPRYTRIGVVLRDKGELDEAIAAFRKALDITPTDGSLLRDLVSAL